jgi:hypothetical protein
MAEDRCNTQVRKTAAEAALELQAGKQRLEDNQSGERGELLVFNNGSSEKFVGNRSVYVCVTC